MLRSLKYVYIVPKISIILIHRSLVDEQFPFKQDFMALLAYEEPEKSPMFHLLSFEYRQHVTDNLNRAILGVYFLRSLVLHILRVIVSLVLMLYFSFVPSTPLP